MYVETAVINFTATDALSGVANIYWRLGAQQSWQSSNKLTHSSEGSYTIEYYADDVAGNVQPTQYFHFDIIPEDDDPPVTISDIPLSWQSQPVTVTLSASDVITDVEHTYYSTDGTTPTVEYTDPFNVNTEGEHAIKYYSVDTAGNEETVNEDTLKIDMTDPQTTSDAQSSYVESGTVILTPSDNLSGIFETRYKLNNDPWSVGTTIALSGRGKQTIEYYSVDNANNTENSHIDQIDILRTGRRSAGHELQHPVRLDARQSLRPRAPRLRRGVWCVRDGLCDRRSDDHGRVLGRGDRDDLRHRHPGLQRGHAHRRVLLDGRPRQHRDADR